MPLTWSLTIAGVEYLPTYADPRTIRPVDSIRDRSDTMSGLIIRIPYSGDSPAVAVPRCGQEIILTRGTGGSQVREFGGVVQRVRERAINPSLMEYEIQASDYVRWFDRWALTLDLEANRADLQVLQIVAAVNARESNAGGTTTWTTAGVSATLPDGSPTPVASSQKVDLQSASSAIDAIAKQVGYRWDVDYYGDVTFTSADEDVAPIAAIDCEADVSASTIGDVEIEDAGDQVVNVVYIKGAKSKVTKEDGTFASHDQSYTTGGVGDVPPTTFFALPYEIPDLDSIFVSVTPPGGSTTIYRRNPGVGEKPLLYEGQDGVPGDNKTDDCFYVCLPNWGLRINPDDGTGNPILPPGTEVIATMEPLTGGDTVYVRMDYPSIAEVKAREGTTGMYEEVIDAGDIVSTTVDAINARGDLALYQRRRKWLVKCRAMNVTGFRSGQYLTMTSSRRFGGAFASGVKMYVMQVEKRLINADVMAVDLQLCSDIYGEV